VITLAVRFLSGRFHATPWDRHVNEGVPEWPISPWRILRALTAARHARCPMLDRAEAEATLRKLTVPPLFTLPAASLGHTRHYLSLNTMKRAETALTIDAFVALGDCEAVYVHWPVDLTDDERHALRLMARGVSYLGRAESWCEMDVVEADDDRPEPNCAPIDEDGGRSGWRCIRVLCPADSMTQADLERTTSSLQREGWNDPPGSRWVLYERPTDAFSPASSAVHRTVARPRPVVAEMALGGTVLPLLTDAVLVAEQVRAAALHRHGAPSETLSGKGSDGARLRDEHQHAHYVPETRSQDRRVTHVLVYAPIGFSESEQTALARVSFLTQRNNRPTLDVVLSGFGSADDFRDVAPLFGISKRWRSLTPFVLVRHPRRGKDTPRDQLVRELRARGFPEPSQVIPIAGARLIDRAAGDSGVTRWVEFVTTRRGYSHPPGGFGFELVFPEPVQGPILLGYGCHYGLGQFEALP
jgi:CRISPR-associated protein Csb2